MFAGKMKSLGIALLMFLAGTGGATAGPDEAKANLGAKFSAFEKHLPLRTIPGVQGLYEVNVYGKAAYTDDKASFFLVGGSMLLSGGSSGELTNWSIQRKEGLGLESVRNLLPLNLAIKTVYGKGERILVTFEDPDCPACKRQNQEMAGNPERTNATVYTFMMPLRSIHPEADAKSRKILCSSNPTEAWRATIMFGQIPTGDGTCAKASEHLDKVDRIAAALGLNSTPSMIFEHGELWNGGAMAISQMERAMAFATSRLPEAEKSMALGEKQRKAK